MNHLIPLEHPGVILFEEFIAPLGLTPYKVAKDTEIPQTALGEILKGKRAISTCVGLKLSKYFGVSEEYFVKIQMQHDIDKIKVSQKRSLSKIIPFRQEPKDPPEDEIFLEA